MAKSANADDVERRIYRWLIQGEYTSEERAYKLATLLRQSHINIPVDMIRNGKLINFFMDRPNLFGIVRDDSSSKIPSIYAIDAIDDIEEIEREGNSGRGRGGPPRGRGGPSRGFPSRYVRSKEAQELLDAQEDAQMVDETTTQSSLPTDKLEYDFTREPSSLIIFDQMAAERAAQIPPNINYGGKKKPKSKSRSAKKSKSKSRTARKSKTKKNKNRRNKTSRKS